MESFAILFFSFLVFWILRKLLNNSSSLSGELPPGPFPIPLVGSLFKLRNDPHRSLAELAATYGPVMTLRLGQVTTVVVSSAGVAKEVLQKNDQSFAGRSVVDAARALGHEGASVLWLHPGPIWRRLRTLCNTCIFSSQRLEASQGLRRRKVEEMLAHVNDSALSGKGVDIGKVAFVTNLNLISNTLFSVDMVNFDSQTAQEFKDLVGAISAEAGKPNIVDYFPILRPFDPQGIRRKMGSYMKKLHEIFEKQMEDREVSRAISGYRRRNDFLDALLDQKEINGAGLSHIEIKSLFVDLFTAGSDTSSNTVEWAMAELFRNPEVMARLRSELDEMVGGGNEVEESDIPRLPYLQAIVKETLRLHPPAPVLLRRAVSDGKVFNYTIPKHTNVMINVWAIGREEETWPDPTCFKPERFLESKVDYRGQHLELIPFGAGRRICPGLPLAFRMVHLVLASLIHSFAWELPAGMGATDLDMRERIGITLQKALPLVAVPSKR